MLSSNGGRAVNGKKKVLPTKQDIELVIEPELSLAAPPRPI